MACGLQGRQALVVTAPRPRSWGIGAELHCGMWDLPRPGTEPVFPTLLHGFSTTEPLGRRQPEFLYKYLNIPGLIISIVCGRGISS